ncbi:hypothetical protein F5X68DRAFT_134025 [Plectosphaerella plurivora]|uniref:Rhodopsin domain-containing protein n=1 Tax=Plectosphaerella plurivora TaxID=936078 RepID=A0A9P9AAB3_9PEZI|nr:hypothetical protein F5X68DRAFT_134025 [Plectosphaerella plurivora]
MASGPVDPAAEAAAKAEVFYREVWALLGVAVLIIALRTYGRIRSVGFANFQLDDYLVWLALLFYSGESVLAWLVGYLAHGIANNGMTDEERANLSPTNPEYQMRITGSIIQLCGWTSYSIVLWLLKGSLLMLYRRLTVGLSRMYTIRVTIGFYIVACSWLIVTLNLFLSCLPLHRMWQIYPDPGPRCYPATSPQVVWMYYAFNVSTDFYLLSIPLPLLWGSRLRPLKKFGLVCLFGGGFFVITCATLRAFYIVTNPIEGAQTAGSWAVRETFVALATTNLPLVFPVVRQWVSPIIGPIISSVRSSKRANNMGTSTATPRVGNRTFGSGALGPQGWRGRGPPTPNPIPDMTFNDSDERFVTDGFNSSELQDASAWGGTKSADTSAVLMDQQSEADPEDAAGNTSIIHKQVEVSIVRNNRPDETTLRPGTPDDQPWALRSHSASASGPGPIFKRQSH